MGKRGSAARRANTVPKFLGQLCFLQGFSQIPERSSRKRRRLVEPTVYSQEFEHRLRRTFIEDERDLNFYGSQSNVSYH